MKPFNLEQALAGHPVCTRDGRPVTQLTKFDCEYEYCVVGVVDGAPNSFTVSGQHMVIRKSISDLFMAPVKKTGWVARMNYCATDVFMLAEIYDTEEAIKKDYPNALSYHEISWEE